eukprot:365608-Chlamydomonas_euryale.AAC.21
MAMHGHAVLARRASGHHHCRVAPDLVGLLADNGQDYAIRHANHRVGTNQQPAYLHDHGTPIVVW